MSGDTNTRRTHATTAATKQTSIIAILHDNRHREHGKIDRNIILFTSILAPQPFDSVRALLLVARSLRVHSSFYIVIYHCYYHSYLLFQPSIVCVFDSFMCVCVCVCHESPTTMQLDLFFLRPAEKKTRNNKHTDWISAFQLWNATNRKVNDDIWMRPRERETHFSSP